MCAVVIIIGVRFHYMRMMFMEGWVKYCEEFWYTPKCEDHYAHGLVYNKVHSLCLDVLTVYI